MSRNETCCAVRHNILVEKGDGGAYILSLPGRNNPLRSFFYPYQIPDGILANAISENYKELAI